MLESLTQNQCPRKTKIHFHQSIISLERQRQHLICSHIYIYIRCMRTHWMKQSNDISYFDGYLCCTASTVSCVCDRAVCVCDTSFCLDKYSNRGIFQYWAEESETRTLFEWYLHEECVWCRFSWIWKSCHSLSYLNFLSLLCFEKART